MPGGLSTQDAPIVYLQGTSTGGATVNGNGTPADIQGYNGAIQVEVNETAGGTATVTFQGSFDGGANWYSVGYYQVDGNATLARSVSAVSVTANMKHVYQILDPYPQLRAVISSIAAASLTIRAYCIPA